MKKAIITLVTLFLITSAAYSQDNAQEKKNKTSFAAKIIHNSAAGFYPIFFANFETNKKFDITMYSIFWTNGAFGNLNSGSDLLLEVAAGIGFKVFNDKLYLNPSFGFASGKFLSNSVGTRLGEGIIPSLYFNYGDSVIDFEGYLAYYKSIRDNENILTKDYVLNWLAPGIKVSDRVVVGAFYETLDITRNEGGENLQIYQWLGGSLKLKLDNGIVFRISGGSVLNTDVSQSDEFYKVSAFIPF
ncbi:DUF6733 family protein [Tenacibaculum xiamenense]|uniref:DUF6733 family protein n=1 Tax=Tenacibaculum xiamenense TaxID=1261553 RepID=UPI00389387CD